MLQWIKILLVPPKYKIIFNIAITKVVALNLFASFLVLVLYTDSWLLFYIASCIAIKAIRKSKGNLIALAFKREKER